MKLNFKWPLKRLRNRAGIIPALIGAAATLGAGYLSSRGGGGGKGIELPPPPKWWEDPFYEKTQEDLYGFGSEGLQGNFPAYYQLLGEYGGPEFEKYNALVNKDITTAATDDAARRRSRGGATQEVIAKAVGESSTKLRFADFQRAMAAREKLLGVSLGAEESVRSGALSNQGMRNDFNNRQWLALLGVAQDEARTAGANPPSIWENLLGLGGDTAGTIGGILKSRTADKLLERGSAAGNIPSSAPIT